MSTETTPADENSSFRSEIKTALNRASAENGSDTPDHVLADYLLNCLAAFDAASPRSQRLVRRASVNRWHPMTNSEARKRAQEAAEAVENSISRPTSPQPANSPSDALGGSQGVEAIRARLQASLDRDLWHPALDDVRVLLAALDEARAEVAENERLMIGMRNARNRAESVVASVRELADEWEVRAGQGIGTLSDAVVDLRTLLPKDES